MSNVLSIGDKTTLEATRCRVKVPRIAFVHGLLQILGISRGFMKYLHTMVRVTDIEQSLRFYRDALGLEELSRKDYPQGRYTLVFLAAPGDEGAQVELTHNWDPEDYSGGRKKNQRVAPLRIILAG